MDARCLLRAIDAVAARKSLKQAWIFSASHTITPPDSCIHRKAINKDKPSLSSGVLPSRQQYHIGVYPGTPPPSVYQVTHDTALQAAECYVRHLVLLLSSRQQSAMCNIIVLTLVAPSGRIYIYMVYPVTQGVASLSPGL